MNYNKQIKYLYIFGMILLLVGCGGQTKPDYLLPEDTYIKLIVELQLIESAEETISSDSLKTEQLIKRVFNKYEVDRQQFFRSHRYYSKDFDKQQERIKRALELLKEETRISEDTVQTTRSRTSPEEKSNAP